MTTDPMLARPCTLQDFESKDWSNYLVEPKHDGMRAVITRSDSEIFVQSRTGKDYDKHVQHLSDMLFNLLPAGTILDGELAVIDHLVHVEGQAVPVVDFNRTMRIMGSKAERAMTLGSEGAPVEFIAFDVLSYAGRDVRELPQTERRAILEEIFQSRTTENDHLFVLNASFNDHTQFSDIYKNLVFFGVEGVIIKNKDSVYVDGGRPRDTWLKVKSEKTFDVVVTGFTDGKGKYLDQIGALEFSALDSSGKMVYVGRCSGMDDVERKRWTDIRDSGTLEETVIEIKCNDLVGSGDFKSPRHPRMVCVRLDKKPQDCLLDQFK